MRRWYGLTSARAYYRQPVNWLRSSPLSFVRPSYLPLIGFGYTLLFSSHSFPWYPHSIPDTKIRGFYTYNLYFKFGYNRHLFPFAQLPQYFPDISARIRCDICSSILYALNCLCHSFLSGLPLFCSLQLPDRISTITEGVLFFLIGRSLF